MPLLAACTACTRRAIPTRQPGPCSRHRAPLHGHPRPWHLRSGPQRLYSHRLPPHPLHGTASWMGAWSGPRWHMPRRPRRLRSSCRARPAVHSCHPRLPSFLRRRSPSCRPRRRARGSRGRGGSPASLDCRGPFRRLQSLPPHSPSCHPLRRARARRLREVPGGSRRPASHRAVGPCRRCRGAPPGRRSRRARQRCRCCHRLGPRRTRPAAPPLRARNRRRPLAGLWSPGLPLPGRRCRCRPRGSGALLRRRPLWVRRRRQLQEAAGVRRAPRQQPRPRGPGISGSSPGD
mmetsp:Transcript_88114/g.285157  ORF Transcript_88114/g.285157 Transcript_88114/m.285157 type:complete len:290 (-) Transcript_88114:299-1168(-)